MEENVSKYPEIEAIKNERKLTDKEVKLLTKVFELCEKVENEKNSFKAAMYKIKLEMLSAKIEREINIREIKGRYEDDRTRKIKDAKEEIKGYTSQKHKMIQDKINYEEDLKLLSEYDPKSTKFMFQDEVDRAGSVEKWLEELKNNKTNTTEKNGNIQNVGENNEFFDLISNVENAVETRNNYDKVIKDLEEMKTKGSKKEKEVEKENRKSEFEEKSLVVMEKMNVFKTLWNALKEGVKQFGKTREENREIRKRTKEINEDCDKKEKDEMKKINDKCLEEIKELKAQIEQLKKDSKDEKTSKKIDLETERELNLKKEEKFRSNLKDEKATAAIKGVTDRFLQKQEEPENEQEEISLNIIEDEEEQH